MAKLRIFGVVNHLTHQYEMLKLAEYYDVEFTYLINNVRKWGEYAHRPIPKRLKWATHYEPGKYDLAILHVDQQHVNPDIGKGWLYRDMNEIIQDIPKIVINHGTPMYAEMYDENTVINGGVVKNRDGSERRIPGMKEKIGDNFMIVNSYSAAERWGWGYPLIHGLDPDEWWDLPKEPRVTLSLSPGGLDKYYNRELITHIKARVPERTGLEIFHTNVNYEVKDWNDYRNLLGSSLLTLTPFKDSPMPRARTEAMLSGCCVLSSRYQDADKFIENGVNGFILPDNPLSYAETIYQLVNHNYKEAVDIGQRAKETAKKYFGLERYLKELNHVVHEVAAGNKPEWDGRTIYD
jgi:glycosyltransferase involved in cell wall biosynthesis